MLLPPLALLLAVLWPAPAPVQADPAIAARCEAARSIIAGQIRAEEKPVIIISNRGFGDDKISLTQFLRGWFRDEMPPHDLADRFLATPHVALLDACPDLPRTLARDGVEFGDEAANAMTERVFNTLPLNLMSYPSNILGFSLPVLSPDGQSAVMHSSATCGSVCGAGWVIWLKRDASGEWKTQSGRTSWIS